MKQIVLLAAIGLPGWFADTVTAQFDRVQGSAFGNGWWSDYSEARAAAQQTGKPLMVVLRCVP